jgi:hypothetical protein
VRDVKLFSRPAATVSGETVWDPEPRDKPKETGISIGFMKDMDREKYADEEQPHTFNSLFGGTGVGGRVSVPGPFSLGRIPADDYRLYVSGLPEGCYVKEATFAGASVRNRPLDLKAVAGDERLRVVLACDAASLVARVTDREGNPVSNVSLYVMPAEALSAAAMSEDIRRVPVDRGWSGLVRTLAPGKYLVLACNLDVNETADSVLKLWLARSKAKEVEIGAGTKAQVALEIAAIE